MRVNEWVAELKLLTKITKFYPQAAYCTFTPGFRQNLNYFIQPTPNISHLLQPIENIIWVEFITFLFEERTCYDEERQLLFLQVKLGGMGITNITSISDIEYQNSKKTTKNLVHKIKKKEPVLTSANSSNQQEKFKSSTEFYDNLLRNIRSKMAPTQLKANDTATSDGASIWLSSLPLTKRKFFDAVLLRCGWELKHLPHECICKAKCNIDHALTCKTGGFVTLRHNEIVNVTVDMLSMVCKDVRKEPALSTTPDSIDELWSEIIVRSFWQRLQRTFVDVRAFYYRNQSLATTMKTMENQNKRKNN